MLLRAFHCDAREQNNKLHKLQDSPFFPHFITTPSSYSLPPRYHTVAFIVTEGRTRKLMPGFCFAASSTSREDIHLGSEHQKETLHCRCPTVAPTFPGLRDTHLLSEPERKQQPQAAGATQSAESAVCPPCPLHDAITMVQLRN